MQDAADDDDMLELGAGDIVEEAPAALDSGPVIAPAAEEERAAPRISTGGGTLFERMANLSRGGTRPEADDDDNDDGLNIPRFLNRQNNK